MTVYLSSDHQNQIAQSGVGRALTHQKMALESARIPYTTNSNDDYDIIHLNTIFPESYLKARRARKSGKAVVYHAHSTAEDFQNSFFFSNALAPAFKWWIKKCYRTADLILTPSDYSKELLENYNLNRPIQVISNGIDLPYWQASHTEKKALRDYYRLRPDRPFVMAAGLQIKRKGILDFIELARALPDIQFIWFGYTDPKLLDREMRAALQTKLPNLIFAGYVDREVLRVAYQLCDLYIFPTYEETEGIVLLEALASKAPTLVRDIPVFSDYEDGVHLYKAQNFDDFKQKIKAMTSGQLPDLTDAGYIKVTEKSIPRIGAELRDHYQYAKKLAKRRMGD